MFRRGARQGIIQYKGYIQVLLAIPPYCYTPCDVVPHHALQGEAPALKYTAVVVTRPQRPRILVMFNTHTVSTRTRAHVTPGGAPSTRGGCERPHMTSLTHDLHRHPSGGMPTPVLCHLHLPPPPSHTRTPATHPGGISASVMHAHIPPSVGAFTRPVLA